MERIEQRLGKALADRRLFSAQVKQEKGNLRKAEERITVVLQAQKVIQEVVAKVQQNAHRQISSVVTRCLRAVFGDDAYEFKVDFRQKRGKTEAKLLFVRDGREVDPITSSGGGMVDVAAFALRLACLCLTRPARRRLLVLDEPFRFVSADYRRAVRAMIEALSKELGVQVIMVTHSHELRIGKVVEL